MDPDTTLFAWTAEKNYPAAYASDKDLTVLKLYGSLRGSSAARNLFVIGPDGRVTYRVMGFNVLSQDAYADLEKAVDAAAGVSSPP